MGTRITSRHNDSHVNAVLRAIGEYLEIAHYERNQIGAHLDARIEGRDHKAVPIVDRLRLLIGVGEHIVVLVVNHFQRKRRLKRWLIETGKSAATEREAEAECKHFGFANVRGS